MVISFRHNIIYWSLKKGWSGRKTNVASSSSVYKNSCWIDTTQSRLSFDSLPDRNFPALGGISLSFGTSSFLLVTSHLSFRESNSRCGVLVLASLAHLIEMANERCCYVNAVLRQHFAYFSLFLSLLFRRTTPCHSISCCQNISSKLVSLSPPEIISPKLARLAFPLPQFYSFWTAFRHFVRRPGGGKGIAGVTRAGERGLKIYRFWLLKASDVRSFYRFSLGEGDVCVNWGKINF